MATRNKFNEGARTKLLQLVCEVTQIITCSHFLGSSTFCIAVKDRLPLFTHVLVQFESILGRYIGSHLHVNIPPFGYVILGIFPE